jgi:hypothetical protein
VTDFSSNVSVTLKHTSVVWPLVLRMRSCDLYFVVLVTMAVTCWWRGTWTFASSVSDVFATGVVTRLVGSAVAGTSDRRGPCALRTRDRCAYSWTARCGSVARLMVSTDVSLNSCLFLIVRENVNVSVTKDVLCAVLLVLDIVEQ